LISTYMNYQLITRDLDASLNRVQSQPMVQRETEYYLENIKKVTSIDEFLADDRLFRYAMKAHGLEDMAYAKAFMRKILEEGLTDPNAFANRLTDNRYKEFARSFDFSKHGANTTIYNAAQQGVVENYLFKSAGKPNPPGSEQLAEKTGYYLANITQVRSIDDLLRDDQLYEFAMRAHGFDKTLPDKDLVRRMLEGGIDNPDSLANQHDDSRFRELVETFNFARYGETTTTRNPTQQPSIDRYLRQTLEEEAGTQNEGVRLALYFERMAPNIDSYYAILGDRALGIVVRTMLGLPDAVAQLDVDKQAQMLKSRIDLEDFKDPKKLSEMVNRFTTLWEINYPSASQQSSIAMLFQPPQFGISNDILMTIAKMKR
jgi:hypothetical protein